MNQSATRLASLLLVVGLHLCVSFLVPQIFGVYRDLPTGVELSLMALVLSQPVLLAAWIAFFPSPLRVRLPAALAVAISSIYTGVFSASKALNKVDVGVILVLLALLLLLLGIAGLMRLIFRRQIAGSQIHPSDDLQMRSQFRIKDLMLWTAAVAVAVVVGNRVLGSGNTYLRAAAFSEVWIPIVVLTGLSLPGLMWVGAFVHRRRRAMWLLMAAVSVVVIPVLFAIPVGMVRSEAFRIWSTLLSFEVSFSTAVLGSLFLLAAGGWRMECGRGNSAFATMQAAGPADAAKGEAGKEPAP